MRSTSTAVAVSLTASLALPLSAAAQARSHPVFDAHAHLAELIPGGRFLETQRAVDSIARIFERVGVRGSVGIASTFEMTKWRLPPGMIRAVGFPCPSGNVPNGGPACFGEGREFPDVSELRAHVESGAIQALGEIYSQYYGIRADDRRMDPYYALAEEFDLPVLVHMFHWSPGGAACCPNHRISGGNPFDLENVLTRFPKLRIVVQHAAAPFGRELLVLMLRYPNVYADISGIVSMLGMGPLRQLAENYLAELAPMHSRLLFGSDDPYRLADLLRYFETVPAFSAEQRQDILYNNAARFFRIDLK